MRLNVRSFAIIAGILALNVGCKPESNDNSISVMTGPERAPDPYFPLVGLNCTAAPISGQAPLRVSFMLAAVNGNPGKPYSYSWDFGDGQSTTAPVVDHTYVRAGEYHPSGTVANDGSSAGRSFGIGVTTGPSDPHGTR